MEGSLNEFDSSKHSGVIAYFNKEFLKTGIFDKKFSAIIKGCSFLREKSDYDDFFIASKSDAERQVVSAELFLEAIESYLKSCKIL